MIIFTIILYCGGVNVYLGGMAYLGYAIMIGLSAAAALAVKKSGDGYLDFQLALKTSFTVFVIALAMQTLFTWLLLNFFDLHFKELVAKANLQKLEEYLRKMGMPEDRLDQAISEEKGKDQFTIKLMIMGLAFSYIVHFIIALVIAAIVKKKKPVFTDAGI